VEIVLYVLQYSMQTTEGKHVMCHNLGYILPRILQ